MEMKWIPRDINVKADYLSRIVHFDDYYLNDEVLAMLILNGDRIQLTGLHVTITLNSLALILGSSSPALRQ